MRKLKAAVIGAGSTYTPELIRGFIDRKDSLDFNSFHLMDINKEKLDIVGGLAKRMLDANGFKGEFKLTDSVDDAVKGADYIFAQIRVGGMEARIRDEKIPLKHGLLGQETTGAGGFMKALRTIPVMMNIAKKIEALAPDAWLINFSNPSGIVAEALMNHSKIKMIGLCNCFVNMKAGIADTIGTDNFDYEYIGLNHLSWITSVTVNGENVLEKLGKSAGAKLKNIPDVDYDDELLAAVPAVPSYYLSYFYLRDEQLAHCIKAEKTRGECCVDIENALIEKYKDPNLNDKPKELEERGGALYSTAAVSAVDAIENDKNEYHVVGVKNNGAIPYMADDDVVEVKCNLNKKGAAPAAISNCGNLYIKGTMQAVKAYEKLTVSAAINGSRKDALAALMVHPLIGDFNRAKAVLNEMAAANKDYIHKGLLP